MKIQLSQYRFFEWRCASKNTNFHFFSKKLFFLLLMMIKLWFVGSTILNLVLDFSVYLFRIMIYQYLILVKVGNFGMCWTRQKWYMGNLFKWTHHNLARYYKYPTIFFSGETRPQTCASKESYISFSNRASLPIIGPYSRIWHPRFFSNFFCPRIWTKKKGKILKCQIT